jgi:hypothetical protein
MKKVFSLLVVLFFFIAYIHAQKTYTWTGGGANGNWDTPLNWTCAGTGCMTPNTTYPQVYADNTVFSGTTATVSINVNHVSTGNSGKVALLSNADITFVNGLTATAPTFRFGELDIATGSKLRLKANATKAITYEDYLSSSTSKSTIDGSIIIDGTSTLTATLKMSGSLEVNGSLTLEAGNASVTGGVSNFALNSGAVINHQKNASMSLPGTYDANSTIIVTGITNVTSSALSNSYQYGNVIWDCDGQAATHNFSGGSTNMTFKGDFTVLNTGGQKLRLGTSSSNIYQKDFKITPSPGKTVVVEHNNNASTAVTTTVTVQGNFIQTGGTFDLSPSQSIGVLKVAKDFTVSGGTFKVGGVSTASSVELNGTVNQNVTGGATLTGLVDVKINNVNQANLLTNLSLPSTLTFTAGAMTIGNNILTVNKTSNIIGADATKYVITNGTTGKLRIANTDAQTSLTFPIGNMAGSYTPLTVANSGTADGFSASVSNNVSGTYADRTKAIQREWDLSEDVAGGSNAILTFQFNTAELGAAMATTGIMEVGHYNGASWDVTPGSISGAGPYMITHSTGFTSFSPFTAGSAQSLPIELLSFEGALNKKKVVLTWQTASEKNNDFFTIERSADNENFVAIGKVAGARQSDVVRAYQYLDVAPLKGINYYRLKQTDLDGHTNTLKTIGIENGNTQTTIAALNSGAGQLHLGIQTAQAARTDIQVIDMNGRVLYATSEELNEGTTELSIQQAFSAGIYMVRLSNELGETVSKMLLVK